VISGDVTFEPPRCSHGNIILGCPHDECPEQNAYLAEQRTALDAHFARQQEDARRLVRSVLGMPEE
jgi:hypothetical protein